MFFPSWLQLRDSMKMTVRANLTKAVVVASIFGAILSALSTAQGQSPSTPIQATEQSTSVHGVVLNANTNQPVFRALVQVGRQSILTAHDGKFEFSGLSELSAQVKVTKPGFYAGLDPYQDAMTYVPVGSTDEAQVRIYPEAILTGSLTATNGDPLPQIFIQALRHVDDESGANWIMGGQVLTNADGEFRLPLPSGEYVIETQFSQSRVGAKLAVLPAIFPAGGSNSTAGGAVSTIHLLSGSEQHLELHPPMRPNHSVQIRIDGVAGGSPGQNFPLVQAHLANGLTFYPVTRNPGKQGDVTITLPTGSYLLSATANGGDDATSYGETKVTVADEDVTGVLMHLQAAAELTVEASVDPSASSADPAPADASLEKQLGLYLEKTNAGAALGNGNVSPIFHRNGQLSFSLLPGTYRLRSTTFNSWYIESATAGGTDLMTQDLVIDGGTSTLPLRLIVGSSSANLKGSVKLAGVPSACYVYLLAATPSTSPIISVRSGTDGSFARSVLPPGSYRVLAAESRSFFDLTDPNVQRHFASYIQTVTVGSGETGSVDLTAVPSAEWKP